MIELIRKRRSRRIFKSLQIPQEALEILKEALLRSPTSRNRRPWKFWFISNPDTLLTLAGSKKAGSNMIGAAPLAVIIGADSSQSDVWIEDCSIAATLLQMTAESLGLGSCWVQIRLRASSQENVTSEEYVKQVLNIQDSDTIKIASIIALGYPDEDKVPIPYDQLPEDTIIEI